MGPLIAALALVVAPAAPPPPPAPPPTEAARPDYARPESWLCRPGRPDPCDDDQAATVIKADGSRGSERFSPTGDPKFDCFYVYPTVSRDPAPNSDMIAGAQEENAVAAIEAGRFARHCRVFAPLYRQVTLAAERAPARGRPAAAAANRASTVAYEDVKAAWDEYLAYDNHGRGVVLIGHGQGAGVLKTLVARAIEGTPAQRQIISVLIPGTNVAVPAGRDVGGDLKSTPLCRDAKDVGCVVSYVAFRADAPPPAGGRFGSVPQPGMVAACVNPAALRGEAATADAYLGARRGGAASRRRWTRDGATVTTPFVKVPGLLRAACATRGAFRYLALTVRADPSDRRIDPIADPIADDAVSGGVPPDDRALKDWGLHRIDLPVMMGDLVALSNDQAKAWLARQPALPAD